MMDCTCLDSTFCLILQLTMKKFLVDITILQVGDRWGGGQKGQQWYVVAIFIYRCSNKRLQCLLKQFSHHQKEGSYMLLLQNIQCTRDIVAHQCPCSNGLLCIFHMFNM